VSLEALKIITINQSRRGVTMEKISANELPARYQPKQKQVIQPKQLTIVEVNKVFESIADLAADGFRPWYCKAIMQLGPTKILDLAELARAAKVDDKRKLMSRLTSDALKGK
jgi:hypothetical protein